MTLREFGCVLVPALLLLAVLIIVAAVVVAHAAWRWVT